MSCAFRHLWLLAVLSSVVSLASGQNANSSHKSGPKEGPADKDGATLQFVVYLTRHGVRSPTGKPGQYDKYSAAPWPAWDVKPGFLTAHGYQLMKLFGVYDRSKLAADGLLSPSGCADAGKVTILADSDQRTRETGKAIAEGMLPGCTVEVHAQAEGTPDPLFHFTEAEPDQTNHQLAAAAIAGRIGGNANSLAEAYRPQLADLDNVLAGCGKSTATVNPRTSIFDVPASLGPGSGDHPAELHGPLNTASTLSEILLLEYTEGLTAANVGWGCADGAKVRDLIQLHSAAADYAQRTPVVARIYASNLIDHIEKALEQSAMGKAVPRAPGKLIDRVLILVGHDTNIASVAGALGLDWILDGRRDDTPPGGSLVFALWRSKANGKLFVRASYTAQTLEQMRNSQALSSAGPPAEVPVFIPGCSGADMSCDWPAFQTAVRKAIDPTLLN